MIVSKETLKKLGFYKCKKNIWLKKGHTSLLDDMFMDYDQTTDLVRVICQEPRVTTQPVNEIVKSEQDFIDLSYEFAINYCCKNDAERDFVSAQHGKPTAKERIAELSKKYQKYLDIVTKSGEDIDSAMYDNIKIKHTPIRIELIARLMDVEKYAEKNSISNIPLEHARLIIANCYKKGFSQKKEYRHSVERIFKLISIVSEEEGVDVVERCLYFIKEGHTKISNHSKPINDDADIPIFPIMRGLSHVFYLKEVEEDNFQIKHAFRSFGGNSRVATKDGKKITGFQILFPHDILKMCEDFGGDVYEIYFVDTYDAVGDDKMIMDAKVGILDFIEDGSPIEENIILYGT